MYLKMVLMICMRLYEKLPASVKAEQGIFYAKNPLNNIDTKPSMQAHSTVRITNIKSLNIKAAIGLALDEEF